MMLQHSKNHIKKIGRYFSALGILSMFLTVEAHAIPYEEVVVSVDDKNHHTYELKTILDLKQGRSSIAYVFYPKDSIDKKILIFGSVYDGESGGCHRHKELNIQKAVTRQKYIVKDLNEDGKNDIGLYFTETYCETGKHIYYEKLLIATENGFELKEKVTKE